MTDDRPERLPITSPDIAAECRARLRELFPEVFHEDKDAAKDSLGLEKCQPRDSRIDKLALAGKDVFAVADGALLLCLDRELTLEVIEAMVSRDPTPSQIICLDAGFQGNDQLKVNVVQTVKSRNRLKEGDLVLQVV